MQLRIIGNAPVPFANGASSGYLVTEGRTAILVECGAGVMPRLRAVLSPHDLTAVLVSHMHADEVLDLMPMALALMQPAPDPAAAGDWIVYTPSSGAVTLYLPPGGLDYLDGWSRLGNPDRLDAARNPFRVGFDPIECDPGTEITVGPFTIRFYAMRHALPTLGMRIEANGAVLAYSADTGYTPALVELARDADLFLCEATRRQPEATPNRHLSAREAGRAAQAAGARRLVLTHIVDDRAEWCAGLVADAAAEFAGPVSVAALDEVYDITASPSRNSP